MPDKKQNSENIHAGVVKRTGTPHGLARQVEQG